MNKCQPGKNQKTTKQKQTNKQTEESTLGTGNRTGAMVLLFVEKSGWEQGMIRLKLWVDRLKKVQRLKNPTFNGWEEKDELKR